MTETRYRELWAGQHRLRVAGSRVQSTPCRVYGGGRREGHPHFGKLPQCPVCVPLTEYGLLRDSVTMISPSARLLWVTEVDMTQNVGVHTAQDQLSAFGVDLRRVGDPRIPESVGVYVMADEISWRGVDSNVWT